MKSLDVFQYKLEEYNNHLFYIVMVIWIVQFILYVQCTCIDRHHISVTQCTFYNDCVRYILLRKLFLKIIKFNKTVSSKKMLAIMSNNK